MSLLDEESPDVLRTPFPTGESGAAVGITVDLHRGVARSTALELIEVIRTFGYSMYLAPQEAEALDVEVDAVALQDLALMVTVGGDGTLLRAARRVAPYGIPLFGINAGRLGFLTETDVATGFRELTALLRYGFFEERRSALEVCFEERRFIALNDVVVRKHDASRVVLFSLVLDAEPAARIPCDGIVVTTPTGSTAYFLSAGGPIVAPDVDAFGIAPLLPHTLFSRPLIVSASRRIAISADPSGGPTLLETDGNRVVELPPGAAVTIERYVRPIRFARVHPLHFFTRLETKFSWGKSFLETAQ